ncbi:MAG: hypothetical protein F2667_14215 [Actinobacteria bacterium]|nr:hypothetical protein [Actinomycetota bacterium]
MSDPAGDDVDLVGESYDEHVPFESVGLLHRSADADRVRRDECRTQDQLRVEFAGLTVLDLLLAGATAVDPDELDHVAHLSLVLFDHVACTTSIELPDGRVVASLHAHISGWRHHGLRGLTTSETSMSGRLARGRPALPAPTS